jgi:phosphorylase kinase alpha/beta subunit
VSGALEGVVVHAERLVPLMRERYAPADLDALERLLAGWGVLDLPALPNGLYAAVARPAARTTWTGYGHTWVRDTVHVASVAWERGDVGSAARTARALLGWFALQAPRFEACVRGEADVQDPMQRPHVRFLGETLRESPQWWPHAQNDALGYGLWFLSRAALSGLLPLDAGTAGVLLRFPRYFAALDYTEDADSGHWEEGRKVNASSIGTVVAGLTALRGLLRARPELAREPGAELADPLLEQGRAALLRILPHESRGNADPRLDRRADAALLFLVHPLRVVTGAQAEAVLQRVRTELLSPLGIRRYLGDSYWCADYTRHFDESVRTGGFGGDLSARDAALLPGTEAQWCLFDPLLACVHGWRFLATRDPRELQQQTWHWNRALGQITGADCALGEGLCPEAFWMPDSSAPGRWEPNDDTPLLWTQALLASALGAQRNSAACAKGA